VEKRIGLTDNNQQIPEKKDDKELPLEERGWMGKANLRLKDHVKGPEGIDGRSSKSLEKRKWEELGAAWRKERPQWGKKT